MKCGLWRVTAMGYTNKGYGKNKQKTKQWLRMATLQQASPELQESARVTNRDGLISSLQPDCTTPGAMQEEASQAQRTEQGDALSRRQGGGFGYAG